jgi:lincosamide nucleotidyltransferase B/F
VIQHLLIDRVRDLCRADDRLTAALMYGSFVTGEADEHSDIEFWLFSDVEVDAGEWLRRIGPIRHVAVNEFGAHVAFFPGLIRGEFHFHQDVSVVSTWPMRDVEIIVDRTGALRAAAGRPVPVEDRPDLGGRFANWLVLTHRVAQRGELLRAIDALTHVQRHLLWLARLAEGHTEHWLTPSRAAETDLPQHVVAALHRATATAGPESVTAALAAAWRLGRDYAGLPEALAAELDAALL